MAITALYEQNATIGTTEYSLTNDSTSLAAKTDDGVFQCFLDLNALIAGDQYEFKVYEKVESGGTQRVLDRRYFYGPLATPHVVIPSLVLMHGWDMTLDKLAGTDRLIAWSIRQVA